MNKYFICIVMIIIAGITISSDNKRKAAIESVVPMYKYKYDCYYDYNYGDNSITAIITAKGMLLYCLQCLMLLYS